MENEFKEIIFNLLEEDSGRYRLQNRSMDYDKAITHGVMGESGEHYYFFIYRDALEKQPLYGGVYFLYKPFNMLRPFEVGFKGDARLRERWSFYLRTAVYFLKKNFHDTMLLVGNESLQTLYDELKQLALTHEKEETTLKAKYEDYDFNVLTHEFKASEVTLPEPDKSGCATAVKELLKVLTRAETETLDVDVCSDARLGLSLILTGQTGRTTRFQPVIVPQKRDGSQGTPKPAIRSQMKNYHWIDKTPHTLTEFMGHLHQLSEAKRKDTARIDMVSQIYFGALVDLLFTMPDHLTFCQLETQDNLFQPLKKISFTRMEIRFAPIYPGETMGLMPVLTADDGAIVEAEMDYHVIPCGENRLFLFLTSFEKEFYLASPVESELFAPTLRFLAQLQRITMNDFPAVVEALKKAAPASLFVQREPLPLFNLDYLPTPVLKIMEKDTEQKKPKRLEVEFDYTSGRNSFLIENPHIRLVHFQVNREFETMCLYLLKNDALLNMGYEKDSHHDVIGFYFTFKRGDDLEWLMEHSSAYLSRGFRIYSDRRKQFIGKTDSVLRIEVESGMHWLDFKPLLLNNETGETFQIENIDFFNSTITDKNGTLHLIKKEDQTKLIKLSRLAQHVGHTYRIPAQNYFLIDSLYDFRLESLPQIKEVLNSARNLEGFKRIPHYLLATQFDGILRVYQEAGVRWMLFLEQYRLSGCLADDMGLGKTVQTLALLQTLKDENRLATCLLVVPVSAVPNWEAEIRKFTPELIVFRHMGANRKHDISLWVEADLVITSYATLRNDIDMFKNFTFHYLILDESQAIKNASSQVTKAVKIIKSNFRLALSGTPIENTSMELWSLFDFLLPGFLGTPQWFRSQWALPVEKYKDTQKTELLKQMVYPFILRRKKEEVEKDLPQKVEMVETLDMEEEQLKLYITTAQYYSDFVARAIDEEGLQKSSFKILEGMLRLRQICLFPSLVNPEFSAVPSIKFDHFTGMLEDILAEGHKVLVFSQFVNVLAIIKEYFVQQQIPFAYLDGSVSMDKRELAVRDFQENPDTRVFLLSLKAGGVALNLTAADYVIIFDPWWNPAVEAQAIDRSHRIGQTRNVFVYRMVVKDTIEEKMLALQQQKKELVESLIASETGGLKSLNREDILKLFEYSASK